MGWIRERWPGVSLAVNRAHRLPPLDIKVEGVNIRLIEWGGSLTVWNILWHPDTSCKLAELCLADPDFFDQLETVIQRAIKDQTISLQETQ